MNDVEKGDGVPPLRVNLLQDFSREKASCPPGVDFCDNQTAVFADKKIDTTIAAEIRRIAVLSGILAYLYQLGFLVVC